MNLAELAFQAVEQNQTLKILIAVQESKAANSNITVDEVIAIIKNFTK